MIVVHGCAKDGTGKFAPFKGENQRLNSWDAIYDSFNKQGLLDTKSAVFRAPTSNGKLSDGYKPATDTATSERGNIQQSIADGGRAGAGRASRSGRATGTGARKRAGNSERADGTFDSQPDLSGRELEQSETTPAANKGNPGGDRGVDDLGLSGQRNGDAVSDECQKKEIFSQVKKPMNFRRNIRPLRKASMKAS